MATFVFTVRHFETRCVHATGHQDGRQNISRMFEKKNALSVIFNNLNGWGIVKSVYVNICWFKRANGSIFIAEVNSRCFHWFSPLLCPSPGHNYGVSILSSINLCKTFLTANLSTKNRKDLRLGKVDKLLISYNITNSWLFLFNSFDFIFSLCDSENQQLKSQGS